MTILKPNRQSAWILVALSSICGFVGCGTDSSMGQVSGVVTLDGQPLNEATVVFQPQQGGSPSAGRTDGSGNYSLTFSRDKAGAVIGKHTVKITTYQSGDPDAEPPKPKVAEKLPAKYNLQTELTADVQGGPNTIDFKLESGGTLVQPDVLEKLEEQGRVQ